MGRSLRASGEHPRRHPRRSIRSCTSRPAHRPCRVAYSSVPMPWCWEQGAPEQNDGLRLPRLPPAQLVRRSMRIAFCDNGSSAVPTQSAIGNVLSALTDHRLLTTAAYSLSPSFILSIFLWPAILPPCIL